MSFDDSVINDLGRTDNSGEDENGFEKFLSKPNTSKPFQPFGGQMPQNAQSPVVQNPVQYEEPQPQQQYQGVFGGELDQYEQLKKQYPYVSQDASAYKSSAKLYEDRYNDFVKTKFKPFYQTLGGFDGDFELDDDYANAIEDMYKSDLELSNSEDGFFGESDEKKAAKGRLQNFTQWNAPNGLRDQFQRLKKEKEVRRALADRTEAQKNALLEQLTHFPRMEMDEALRQRKQKPQSRKATNEMLDQMQFEEPGMVNPETGRRSNLYKTDPRNKIKGMVNPETGKRSKDFYAQQDRMAAAMRGDVAGFMSRRESVAKDRQMRDRGILFSQNGMLDGYPVGLSREDADILDIEKAQKMGIKEYKGRPIEQAFNELGGKERLDVAKIMNAVRSAYSNREKAQIDWLASGRQEDLKAPMDEANESFDKAIQLAAEFGLTDEIVEQTESKGFFARMAGSLKNAFRRGLKMNEMSKYADDFFSNALEQSEIEKFIEAAEELGEIPTSSAAKKFQNYQSKGLWDSISNLLFDNPEAIPELFVESMSSFLPAYVRTGMVTIPGGAAAGGVAGLAGGPLAPVTISGGALSGAGIAARLNWGTASMVLEYSGMVLQGMQELNIDWQNPKVFAAAWNNKITRDAIKEKALKKGLPIALLDALSGMMAGKVSAALHHGGNAIKGGKLIDGAAWKRSKQTYPRFTNFQRGKNIGLEIGSDAAAGMGGEFLGQAWSKEPGEAWDTNAIAAEGLIGLGPGLLGGAYEFAAKPDVSFEGTPFDYEGVSNTQTGQTGTVNLAGYRNQFHSFNDARPAAAHVLNEGNYANAEAKDNATRVLTDIMGRLYAINPKAMSELKIVVADRTPYADKEMEGSYHFDHETQTSVIYINRNKIGNDPLGVFLHEAGHLARHLMMDKAELLNIYDSIGADAQNDAFAQYTLKIPEIKYSQLDESQKARVDKAKNSSDMTKLRMAEEWFSYQFANLLAGHKVDPSVKTEYQNFLTNVIHPAMERFIGGETTGGSKEQKFNFDQMILRKMGFNPDGTPKEGPKFGQYYQERAGMADRFFGNDMPIQQMGDEEALNHLMRKVEVIRQTEGEARAKQVAEATNKILGKKILPTEMSAYTNLELQETLTPLGEAQIDAQDAVATAEILETLEGKDAKTAANKLVEEVEVEGDTSVNVTETARLEETLKQANLELQDAQAEFDRLKNIDLDEESPTKTPGVIKQKKGAGKRIIRAKQSIKAVTEAIEKAKKLPTKTKAKKVKVAKAQKVIDKLVDQETDAITQTQALMPGADITQKGDKFELRTRQPGTRKAGSTKTFDTKEAAEKAKKDFYKDEFKKLKDTSQAVTNLKKLVLNEKEFEKEAAKVQTKLLKELQSKQSEDSKKQLTEEDISYGQIIAEMMNLEGLQANAIFSSALAGDRISQIASMKAPDGQRVVQAFEEYEQKVESASFIINERIADLEKRKKEILKSEALGSAQATKGGLPPGNWVVVLRTGRGTWKKWQNGKWVNAPKLDGNKFVKKRLDKKFYNIVAADKTAADKTLNEKQKKFIHFWREPANKTAPAKKTTTKAKSEKTEKKGLTKEQKAEITEIDKKITMLKQYLDAIQPEKAAIDWKDTPHMTYHKYVGPKGKMSFKEENFERYTLGQLASTEREEDRIWEKRWDKKTKRHRFVEVKGVSDTQDYLFKYTNWRLNEQEQEQATEAEPKPAADVERVNVTSVTKIISGGQTGADRAGLYAGKDLGVETGGIAPQGFKTDSKSDQTEILKGFGLTEVSDDITKAYTGREKIYGPRTEQNVLGSDGTVLFGDESSPGSKLTKNLASKHKKPYLANPTAEELRAWIAENDIKTLNVAGNREAKNKGIFKTARTTIVEALSDPKTETATVDEVQDKDGETVATDLDSGLANPDKSQAFNPFVNGRKLTDKLPWFGDKTVKEYIDILDAVRASAAMPENVGERPIGKAVKSEGKEVGQKDRIFFQPEKGTTVAAMMLFRLKDMDRKSEVNSRVLVTGSLDRVTLSEMMVYEIATGRALEILDDRDFRGSKQQRYHQVIERKAVEMTKDIKAYEKLLAETEDPKQKEGIEKAINDIRRQLAGLVFDYDEIGAFQGEETGGTFAKIHGGKVWTESLTEFMFYREKADAVQTILDIWEEDIASDQGPGMGKKPKERRNAPEQEAISSWLIYQSLKRTPGVRAEDLKAALSKFNAKAEKARNQFEEAYAEKSAEEGTQAAKEWGVETVPPDEYEFFGPGEKATLKVKETSAHGSFARGAVDEGIPVLSMFAKGRADNFNPEKTTFGTGSGSEQANIGLAAELDRKVREEVKKRLDNLLKRKESQNIDAFEITKPDGKKLKVKRVDGVWKKANNHKLPKDLKKIAEDVYVNSRIDVIDSVNKDIEDMDANAIAGVSSGAHVSAVQLVDFLLSKVKEKGFGKDALKNVMKSLEWNPSSETKDGILKQLPGGPAGGLLPYVWFDFITALYKKLRINSELKLTEASDPAKSGWSNVADEMIRTVSVNEKGEQVDPSKLTKEEKKKLRQTRISEKNDLYKNGIPDMDTMVEMVKPIIQAVYNAGRVRLNSGRGFDEVESVENSANAANVLQRDPLLHENPLDAAMNFEAAPEGVFDNMETGSALNRDEAKQNADDLETGETENIDFDFENTAQGKLGATFKDGTGRYPLFVTRTDPKFNPPLKTGDTLVAIRTEGGPQTRLQGTFDEAFEKLFRFLTGKKSKVVELGVVPKGKKAAEFRLYSLGSGFDSSFKTIPETNKKNLLAKSNDIDWSKFEYFPENTPKNRKELWRLFSRNLGDARAVPLDWYKKVLPDDEFDPEYIEEYGLPNISSYDVDWDELKNWHKEHYKKLKPGLKEKIDNNNARKKIEKGQPDNIALGSSYSLSSGIPDNYGKVSMLSRLASKAVSEEDRQKFRKIIKNFDFKTSLVDQADPPKQLVANFLKSVGIKDQALIDAIDVHGKWHQYYGKGYTTVEQSKINFIEPIKDAMAKHGVSNAMLGEYLLARAAPSRNLHLEEMYKAELKTLEEGSEEYKSLKKMLDERGDSLSGINTEDAIERIKEMEAMDPIKNFILDEKNPLQLFYDMNREALLLKEENGLIQKGELNERKAMVQAMSKYNINKISRARMKDNYNYAPMQGFEGETEKLFDMERAYEAVGKSSTASGRGMDQPKHALLQKGAFGRTNTNIGPDPETVFATAQSQYFDAAIRGHKNEVSNAFGLVYELMRAIAYPDDSDGITNIELPKELQNLSPEIKKKVKAEFDSVFEKEFRALDSKLDYEIDQQAVEINGEKVPGLKMVRRVISTTFQNNPNVFVYRKEGVPYFIKFKGESGARMAASLKNLRYEALPRILQLINKLTRFMAQMFTSMNPAFIIPNFIRDVGTTAIHLSEDDKKNMIGKTLNGKRLGKFMKAIFSVEQAISKGERINIDNTSLEFAQDLLREGDYKKMYQFAKEAGAKIGYFRHESIPELIDKLRNNKATDKKGAKARIKSVLQYVDSMNTAVENSIRMSAFWSAIETGRTVHQAANIARNVTVDFNQKGNLTQAFGSLFVFFGASMNSAHRFARTLKIRGAKSSGKLIGGIVAASFLVALFNRLIDDDEDEEMPDYDTITTYKRDSNLLLPLPGNIPGLEDKTGRDTGYFGIPLPLGYNVFWALGQTSADFFAKYVMGRGGSGALDFLSRNMESTMNAFNPIGGAMLQTALVPTAGKPIVEMYANKNFMGTEIRKSDVPYEAPKAAHMMDNKRTQEFWTDLSRFINKVLGGSDQVKGSISGLFGNNPLLSSDDSDYKFDLSGSEMEHFALGYLGGPGQIINMLFGDGVYPLIDDKEYNLDINKMPVVNRFIRTSTYGSATRRSYYKIREAAMIAKKAVEASQKIGPKEYRIAQTNNKPLIDIMPSIKAMDGRRSKIRDMKSKIENNKNLANSQKMQRIEELERKELNMITKVIKKAQSLGIS